MCDASNQSHQLDTLANHVAGTGGEVLPEKSVLSIVWTGDTTGLVVIAKNKYVHHYIQSRMRPMRLKRLISPLVNKCSEEKEGCIRVPIGRPSEDSLERTVMEGGRVCHTSEYWKATECCDGGAGTETGRTHQIRVHLKYIGPIIKAACAIMMESELRHGCDRQALHAVKLNLTLPQAVSWNFPQD